MQKQAKSIFLGSLALLFLLGLDQGSKYLAVTKLKGQSAFPLISGVFELQYLENHGAAFGVLQNQRVFLLLISVLILGVLFVVYWRIPRERHYLPMQIICVLIGAGAIGNMLDRILHGYVIDFFYFRLINFPVFNVADCYVTISCILVLIYVCFFYREEDFAFLFHRKKSSE